MEQELSVVGKRLPRPDGVAKVTGAAKFAADIKLPEMLIGKVLRSPYAHAKIVKIDTSKARKLPGVEAVITPEDVPKKSFNRSPLGITHPPSRRARDIRDEYVLTDKARYIGDAVAAVAAVNEMIAEEALELIEVEYEKLAAMLDTTQAMKPDAARIHDFAKGNIASHIPYAFATGDVESGFKAADHVIEETFSTSKQKNCQLEPDAAVASFEANGKLTIWSSCQNSHLARASIAEIFDLPLGKVRYINATVGGGFGGRCSFNNELVCIALAKKAGKPVKVSYSREEDFVTHEGRAVYPVYALKLGVKKDGTITALQSKIISDAGAYYSQSGGTGAVTLMSIYRVYKCPNKSGELDIIYTNTPHSGGMRGYGDPEAMFCLEQVIDMAAEKIGMDPLQFRLKNHLQAGDPAPILPIESCALDQCIKAGAERIGWKEKKNAKKEGIKRRGVGMSIVVHGSGTHPALLEHSNAFIRLNQDGSANLFVSPCEMGQGILGALAQIAAETLGLSYEDIHVTAGDTDLCPFDTGSHASRSTYIVGNAVVRAAAQVKQKLLERGAKNLGVSASELDIKEGQIYVKAAPEKRVSVAETVTDATYNFERCCEFFSENATFDPDKAALSFQACFVEIEVNTETGEVTVLKIVIAHDIGRAINPMNVEGQLEGGATQALGWALYEDFAVSKVTGKTITDSFATYKIPATLDMPEIEIILVEEPVPSGPFGAKGVGEPGHSSPAAAIANAVYDAVGIRIKDLPITPEKILNALKTKRNR